jgi:hypothetical protein
MQVLTSDWRAQNSAPPRSTSSLPLPIALRTTEAFREKRCLALNGSLVNSFGVSHAELAEGDPTIDADQSNPHGPVIGCGPCRFTHRQQQRADTDADGSGRCRVSWAPARVELRIEVPDKGHAFDAEAWTNRVTFDRTARTNVSVCARRRRRRAVRRGVDDQAEAAGGPT